MSFNIDYLSRITSSGNYNAPVWWSYNGQEDALSTILASGYFNKAQAGVTGGKGRFKTNDLIYIEASNVNGLYIIQSITGDVTFYDFYDRKGLIQLATNDEAAAGIDNNKAITPATLKYINNNYGTLFTQWPGYKTFWPSGLVINWGLSAINSDSELEITITRPAAYTYVVQTQLYDENASSTWSSVFSSAIVIEKGASWFKVKNYSRLPHNFYWLTIGGPTI